MLLWAKRKGQPVYTNKLIESFRGCILRVTWVRLAGERTKRETISEREESERR